MIDYLSHQEKTIAEVTDLGKHQMILDYTWLKHHNPEINWKTGGIRFSRCPEKCKAMEKCRRSNISMDIKITEHLAKEQKDWKEIVPVAYHGFTKAFEEGQYNKCDEASTVSSPSRRRR